MSIYRRINHRTGKRAKFFTAEFFYHGKLHRRSGFADKESARHWHASESLKLRRSSTGYVKPMLAAQVVPLIQEFCAHLTTKGCDEKYVYVMEKRLTRLAGDCGWKTLGHLSRARLEDWAAQKQIRKGRTLSDRTKNQYLDAAIEFGDWLASEKVAKLPSNPLSHSERLKAKHNDEYRRAGTVDELNKLLATCARSRRLYYLFRIYSPMRTRTIHRLTWRMMDLDATPPFAKTPAEINKSRKEEKHPIRYDIAQKLRKARKKARVDDLVFPDSPTIDDLRDDLATAGVRFCDDNGNARLDFHALRRTLVKMAKLSGLSLDQASLLLGHKDLRTTRKHYDEDQVRPELGAMVEQLPALGQLRRAE